MFAIRKLIAVAKAEIGYIEKATNSSLDSKIANAGNKNWTKYARDLDKMGVYNSKKNGYSWCDIFVDWCFIMAFGVENAMNMLGQDYNGVGAGCGGSVNYYKSIGKFFTGVPEIGDQIFFSNKPGGTPSHTGIVVDVRDSRVYTIEGNTSSSAGVVDNGGSVCEKSYYLSYNRIYGYGRPDWSIVEMEDDEGMDAQRFGELFAELRKEWQDNDCGNYSAEARAWAIKNGLITGNGTTDDGEPNYMWNDILSRQQFIVVLHRFAKLMGKA